MIVALVLMVGPPAVAELTAFGVYNTDTGNWAADNGFDWVKSLDGPQPATVVYPWIPFTPPYLDWDPNGKWGGASHAHNDETGHAGGYVQLQSHPPDDPLRALVDDQGTLEFWFRPDWDPATDAEAHCLLFVNFATATGDGLRITFNGDGTMTSRMITQSVNHDGPEVDVGHDWTSMALIDDWNHVAFVWDDTGNRTYANGHKVGETIYTGAETVDWADTMYWFTGQNANLMHPAGPPGSPYLPSRGSWDAAAIYSHVRYAGDTYDVPTREPALPGIGDVNQDGFVGQADLDIVLAAWGTSPPSDPRADLFEDNLVGQADLDTVLSFWGEGEPPPVVPEPATLSVLALGGLALMCRRRK